MNIIGHKYVFLTFSVILVLASIVLYALWGLKLGIDFTGGSLIEVEFSEASPSLDDVKKYLAPINLGAAVVQPTGERGLILRFKDIDEERHQQVLRTLSAAIPQNTGDPNGLNQMKEKRFDSIGPTIGQELKRKSILAVVFAIIAIVLYVAWAFRHVSRPVSSWKYGATVIVALVHDVAIPIGFFSALGYLRGVEIDPLFITALLTILGFSVHDTIVVFDRIRENLRKLKTKELFAVTVNRSVNETLMRSINTSCTVLIVLVAIFFLGGETTKYFSLALIIGIIFGTYSSIFVASPLLVIIGARGDRRKA